jgi:hypothetical protein
MSGPSRFGFGCVGVQLAMVAALGLKFVSVGLLNVYFEGWSYRNGGSTPMVTAGARSIETKECVLEGKSDE